MTFQADGQVAAGSYLTLLTPQRFRGSQIRSRLCQFQFDRYQEDRSSLLAEFAEIDKALPRRHTLDWQYPDLNDLATRLELHWATYEELFSAMPESDLHDPITELGMTHGDAAGG